MTTQTEALKLALEAYLCREMPAGTVIGDPKWWVPKIATAIKEALAQQSNEQVEPVAYRYMYITEPDLGFWFDEEPTDLSYLKCEPLYTHPPVPTAQPKEPEHSATHGEPVAHWSDCAVHNEPAYPKGECDCGGYVPPKPSPATDEDMKIYKAIADNYTTPPQRKPLTDDEIWKFWCSRPEVPEGEDDSMEAEFIAAVRRVLAAHGIKE